MNPLKTREEGVATASELDTMDAEIQKLVAESRDFAEKSPWPEAATAAEHIYAVPTTQASAKPPAASATSRSLVFQASLCYTPY